jgi:tripartite-type tricarboxylate transporter receptor subunit TctC
MMRLRWQHPKLSMGRIDMTGSRRTFLAGFGAATAIAVLPRRALAAYPDRPIRLIVPFAAGGNADIVGRLVGEQISKALGQSVVVENRGGAGGGVGAEFVAQAEPDGYTLLVGSNGPLTVNPFVNANLKYDSIKDFAPVALTSYVPHGIVVNKAVEAKTISDLIALSKKGAVTIATAGVGSATHMTLERLKAVTGADLTHVPYRGGGSLLPDVISGNVTGAMTEFSTALSLHKSGDARILAVAAAQRSKLAPDIPTFDESGVKGFKAQSYIGILAPGKTPADIVARLQQAIEKGLAPDSPAVERLVGIGAEVATAEQMTSKGFADFIRADYEQMREAAKAAGMTPK